MSLTPARLKELLHYDPETGEFVWLVHRQCKRKGSQAGTTEAQGYRVIKIDGKSYKAHRLVWLYMTGGWPQDEVDHENMDRVDNRLSNLRPATHSQNQANAKLQKNNKSGAKGVWWNEKRQRWRACIGHRGKIISLGDHKNIDDAADAYENAATKIFGEYARVS